MLSETSASGSMFIETNGKKSSYAWSGKMSHAPRGLNIQANVTVDGKTASLNLKNKSLSEIQEDPEFIHFFKKMQTRSTRRAARSRKSPRKK